MHRTAKSSGQDQPSIYTHEGPSFKIAKFMFWPEKKRLFERGVKEVSKSFTANSTWWPEGSHHDYQGQHSVNQHSTWNWDWHQLVWNWGSFLDERLKCVFFLTLIRVHDRLETRMFHDTTNVQTISWNDTTVHTFIICCHRDKPLGITYLHRKLKYSSCLACVVCLMMVWKVWRSRAQMWDWDTAGWERLHLNKESHAFLGIINDLLY